MRSWLLAAGLVLAGCAAPDSDGADGDQVETIPADWAARAVPYELHDHFDPLQHQNLSTSNFELLAWDPLISDHYGRTAGGHLCGDATDGAERRLAVVHGITTDVAFALIDVTNATAPEVLGEFILPRSSARDVALTPDGRYVVVGLSTPDPQDTTFLAPSPASAGAPASPAPPADPASPGAAGSPDAPSASPMWRNACGERPLGPEQDLPLPPGVLLVDIQDPYAPVIVDIYPMPVLGAHSVYAGSVPGRTIVIVSVVNLAQPATNFHFFEVRSTPYGGHMVPMGIYTENPATAGAPLLNGHNDGVVQRHPVTGQDLAYLANWDQGLSIVDIGSPAMVPVGHWNDGAGPGTALQRDGIGSVHEAIPIDGLWDGRHYTLIGQEILDHPSRTPSGWVKVLDTTDPSAPTEVAEWTLPVDVVWDASLVFSTHYLAIHDRTMFIAHYHAGVWAVDLSCIPACKHPPAIGVFVPANVSPAPPPTTLPYDWTPTIMEVDALENGDLVVFDATSGFYLARFDATNPAPPAVFAGYET